jgi:hypothetical protein
MTLVSTKEGEVSSSDRQTSCKDHSTSLASDGIMWKDLHSPFVLTDTHKLKKHVMSPTHKFFFSLSLSLSPLKALSMIKCSIVCPATLLFHPFLFGYLVIFSLSYSPPIALYLSWPPPTSTLPCALPRLKIKIASIIIHSWLCENQSSLEFISTFLLTCFTYRGKDKFP